MSRTLIQIREKNRTETDLISQGIIPQEYSEELIKQCKEEFETFVKPIRDRVMDRMINKCTEKALKNLAEN